MIFSKMLLTLSILVTATAHAKTNSWTERLPEVGQEIYVPNLGQCLVVATKPGDMLSVVGPDNLVREISCRKRGLLILGDAHLKYRGEYTTGSDSSIPVYDIQKLENQSVQEGSEASPEDAII